MNAFQLQNKTSANRAADLMALYAKEIGNEPEDYYSLLLDLLTDLMHYAKENKVNFERALASARGHYQEETKWRRK